MISKSYQISMEVSGNTAIWTRPDSGDSPCSYPAPTYSAVEGLFESVLYKQSFERNARDWDRRTTSPGHAYQEIFNRRLSRGQSYATLSLGWSEFTVSYFGPFRDTSHVCTELPDIHIPSMLRGVFRSNYNSEYCPVYDTDLCIHQGVLEYPKRSGWLW